MSQESATPSVISLGNLEAQKDQASDSSNKRSWQRYLQAGLAAAAASALGVLVWRTFSTMGSNAPTPNSALSSRTSAHSAGALIRAARSGAGGLQGLPTVFNPQNFTFNGNYQNTYSLRGNFIASAPSGVTITAVTNFINSDTHNPNKNILYKLTDQWGNEISTAYVNSQLLDQDLASVAYLSPGTVLPDQSIVPAGSGVFGLTYQETQTAGYTNIYFVTVTPQGIVSNPVEINVDESINVLNAIPTNVQGHAPIICATYQTTTGTSEIVLYSQNQQIPTTLSTKVNFNTPMPYNEITPAVASNNQTAAVAWVNNGNGTNPTQVMFRTFTYNGNTPALGPEVIASNSTLSQSNPAIDIGPNGTTVLSWQNSNNTVSYRIYDASGNPLISETIATDLPGCENPVVKYLANGDFLLTCNKVDPNLDNNWNVWGKIYQSNGQPYPSTHPLGVAFLVNGDDIPGEQSYPNAQILTISGNTIVCIAYRTATPANPSVFDETMRCFATGPNAVTSGDVSDPATLGNQILIYPPVYYADTNITSNLDFAIIPASAGNVTFPNSTSTIIRISLSEAQIKSNYTQAISDAIATMGVDLTTQTGPVSVQINVSDNSGLPAFSLQIPILAAPAPTTAVPTSSTAVPTPSPTETSNGNPVNLPWWATALLGTLISAPVGFLLVAFPFWLVRQNQRQKRALDDNNKDPFAAALITHFTDKNVNPHFFSIPIFGCVRNGCLSFHLGNPHTKFSAFVTKVKRFGAAKGFAFNPNAVHEQSQFGKRVAEEIVNKFHDSNVGELITLDRITDNHIREAFENVAGPRTVQVLSGDAAYVLARQKSLQEVRDSLGEKADIPLHIYNGGSSSGNARDSQLPASPPPYQVPGYALPNNSSASLETSAPSGASASSLLRHSSSLPPPPSSQRPFVNPQTQ